ncbi:MAG: protein translocase subunit SecF [Ignavibacteriaceae bacterium]
MRIFEHIHIDWLGKRKLFYTISISLFVIGWTTVFIRGLKFGIDFKGGTEIVLEFQKPIDVSSLRNYLGNIGIGNVELKTFGGSNRVLVGTELQELPHAFFPKVIDNINSSIDKITPGLQAKVVDTTATSVTYQFANPDTTNLLVSALFREGYQTGKVSEEPNNTQMIVRVGIAEWLKENLKTKLGDNSFSVLKEDHVGPKVGNELKTNAVLAIFISLIGILTYLAFRFRFIFALGAVVALFHDVLITIGLYAALYGIIPGLNLEIDLTVVAAFLTLIGYSVADTVIVFDRVRENLKIHKTMDLEELINQSVNRTMSRTILTAGTVLMAITVLLIFGGEVLRAFSFTLFFGTITGTYSSIFVASALVLEYANRTHKKVQF